MKYAFVVMALLVAGTVSGCESEKVEVLKSPCVGADDSPCGPKRTPEYNV